MELRGSFPFYVIRDWYGNGNSQRIIIIFVADKSEKRRKKKQALAAAASHHAVFASGTETIKAKTFAK